jgi:hypothetical protein
MKVWQVFLILGLAYAFGRKTGLGALLLALPLLT